MYHSKYRLYHGTIYSEGVKCGCKGYLWYLKTLRQNSRFGNISCLIILFIDYHIIYTQWRTAGENRMQREITRTEDFRNREFCLSVFKYHGTLVLWLVLLGCTRVQRPSFNSFRVKEGGEVAPEMYHPKYRMYHSTIYSDGVKWGCKGVLLVLKNT